MNGTTEVSSRLSSVYVLGVRVDRVTTNEALTRIDELIQNGAFHYIVTPNPEIIMRAQFDERFRTILNGADLSISDGIGLVWAASYLESSLPKLPLPLTVRAWMRAIDLLLALAINTRRVKTILTTRVAGSDMVEEVAKLAAHRGYTLFLLGGEEGVAEKARAALERRHRGIRIVGTYPGRFTTERERILDYLTRAKPDIVFVAYGAPNQELWIFDHRMIAPARVYMGVGGALDFVSGHVMRAPRWLRNLGFEWLFRFIVQPWRFKRILTAVPKFIVRIVREKITREASKKLPARI
ncbi:MAG: WecB/TagA/CpsF family glycosyltransferase [Parcubacteria group bacterium]|nr:WecB/TagA/CpsF family glycosyltransferase [Parcubacteria group bacterium]